MAMTSLGDMAQLFTMRQNNTSIKTQMNTLTNALSTGRASDLAAHLGQGQNRLVLMDRDLQRIDAFALSASELSQTLDVAQIALSAIQDQGNEVAQQFLLIDQTATEAQITLGAGRAEQAMTTVLSQLNTQYAGRPVFGGTAATSGIVVDTDTLMTQIRGHIVASGAIGASAIEAAVLDWFADPAGYDVQSYAGETTDRSQFVADGLTASLPARADSAAIKEMLAGLAIGVIAGEAATSLTDARILVERSAETLMSATSGLATLQGQVGFSQEQVEDAQVRNTAQQTALTIQRNEMVSVDQYETAAALQEVQTQLELHYTLTARLSSLTLAGYLR